MSLRKEIEKSLRREDNEVDAVEDQGMKDSVLAIASTDFKENDVLDLPLTSRKRSEVDISADYPGKPVSRKKYGKDVGAIESDGSDDGELSDSSLAGLNDGLMGLDDIDESEDEDVDDGEDEDLEEEEEDDDDDDVDDAEEEESDMDQEDQDEGSARPGSDEDESSPLKVFHSAPAASGEIRKGQAVKEQLRLWESLLECRIKLEPALVAANQLYQRDKMTDFINEVKSLGSSEYDAVRTSLQELSSSFKKLQVILGAQSNGKDSKKSASEKVVDDGDDDDESIHSSEASGASDKEDSGDSDLEEHSGKLDDKEEDDGAPPPKKQKTSADQTLDQLYTDFSNYRDTEMDKWNEKAKVSSGRAAQKDFSAFDQSILKLIESILFDKYRLVRKTQQKRTDYVIYGKPKSETKKKDEPKDDEEKEDGTLITNDKSQSKKDVVYDPEIFDDGDFYQKLLRDFIEAKSSDGGLSKHERKLMELHRLRIKMKRKVDTRATKGRKLRYVVHPKLVKVDSANLPHQWGKLAYVVSFMAPVMSSSFPAEAEAQLLKSLFGQAVTSSA